MPDNTHPDSATENHHLMKVGELAKLLGVTRRTIWRKLSKGEIIKPTVRLGSVVRWLRQEVYQWVSLGCPKPAN